MIKQLLNSAFVWCEELSASRRLLCTSAFASVGNSLLDLHNSSHSIHIILSSIISSYLFVLFTACTVWWHCRNKLCLLSMYVSPWKRREMEGNDFSWCCRVVRLFLYRVLFGVRSVRLLVVSPASCSLTSEVDSRTCWVSSLTAFGWSVAVSLVRLMKSSTFGPGLSQNDSATSYIWSAFAILTTRKTRRNCFVSTWRSVNKLLFFSYFVVNIFSLQPEIRWIKLKYLALVA